MVMSMANRLVGLVFAGLVGLVVVSVVGLDRRGDVSFPSVGVVRAVGVGVYWDNACTREVAMIDWGQVEPGSTKNVTVFIRNEGNVAVTLSLDTANWNPTNASRYITLNWNYTGQEISPDGTIRMAMFLWISPSIEGISTFSFDIMIVSSF
jgi:hypothetical protein